MKKIIFIFSILFTSLTIKAQSTNVNYVQTKTYLDANADNSVDIIQYYDGLGRNIETVQKAITPLRKDLINTIFYDECGRVKERWYPAPSPNNTGEFMNLHNFTGTQNDFYWDPSPFSFTEYETSALSRVVNEWGIGDEWYFNQRYKSHVYISNAASDIAYYYVENNALKRTGFYGKNTLDGIKNTDEDFKENYEYKDNQGRVIMQQQGNNVRTYYVYNDFDQLSYVLPPLAADSLPTTGTIDDNDGILKRYAYIYKYDERGNCIQKRLPGCEPIYMIYDKANRMVLSQDGNQRALKPKRQWTMTTYDALGRVAYTGTIINDSTQALLKPIFDNVVVKESYDGSSTFGGTGYTCSSVPAVFVRVKPLTVNYYDNYDFLNKLAEKTSLTYTTPPSTSYGTQYVDNSGNALATGLLTGMRTYLLKPTISYVATALYYDYKGQVVQQRASNNMGGYDNTYNGYNFTGKLLATYKDHYIANFTIFPEQYSYTYDQAGRPLVTTYQYSVLPPVILSSYKYDELGRLITNYRHNTTDSVKYQYNIRNWITKINSGPTFEENLYYNTNPVGATPNFNGNISFQLWFSSVVTQGYKYEYDELNRLKEAAGIYNGVQTTTKGNESYTYDKMGNIKTLSRMGMTGTAIDNLQLFYNGNQLTSVTDASGSQNSYSVKEYQNKANTTSEMDYDANGNMKKDLDRDIVAIRYNLLNLPDTIQFKNGNMIINRYNAIGQKLRTDYYTRLTTITPIGENTVINPETAYSDVNYLYSGTAYIDNKEYSITKNKALGYGGIYTYSDKFTLVRMYNAEGYIDNLNTSVSSLITAGIRYNYYRTDHLGNVREVWNGIRKNYSNVVKEQPSTRQRTQYYPSGLPWAEGTGASVQSRKYNGKEFIEMHGFDETDLGARGVYNAKFRFDTMDRFSEKYPWQSPYCVAANNPLNNIDIKGDSAWQITNHWNEKYIAGYYNYVSSQTQKYIEAGQKFTCEDFALSLLIDYASSNSLPVTIENGSGQYDARSDDYTDIDSYKNDVLETTGARDLQNSQNTTAIDITNSKSGDIIINRYENNIGHHVQVIATPQIDGIVSISQGNSGALNVIPGASRILGSGNPNSTFYTGQPIEQGSYNINAGVYFNRTTNKTINNYRTVKNIDVRRWNFKKF